MHLVYVLLYFFLAAPVSTKCQNLGGWEISSFGRLRGTHRRFCECLCFSHRFSSAPWASSITIEYECSSMTSIPTGCCSDGSALRYLHNTIYIS